MPLDNNLYFRLRRLFFEGFTAMDLAEALVSFDLDAHAATVRRFLMEKDFEVAGVRNNGLVCGYVHREALTSGCCGDHLIPFSLDHELVSESASLVTVVRSMSAYHRCFVSILGQPAAIITLDDLEKPPMRMFLFGIISISEMVMTDILRVKYDNNSWQQFLSASRLEKAQAIQMERNRRGQQVDLIDCLQYGDKGLILSHDHAVRETMEFRSRREFCQAINELEMLRNNLAHTQAIIPVSWQRIVIMCNRIEQNLKKLSAIRFTDKAICNA